MHTIRKCDLGYLDEREVMNYHFSNGSSTVDMFSLRSKVLHCSCHLFLLKGKKKIPNKKIHSILIEI